MKKMLCKMSDIMCKKLKILRAAVIILVIFIVTVSISVASFSEDVNKELSDNLLRLHVIANSDSNEDQELKRNVRDAVLEYMKDKLKNVKNIEEAKSILNENMSVIEEISKKKISDYGKDYGVKAMLGQYPFPTKMYGDIALPAGEYQALRIVIGNGEGANWWCVLFPPLCFVDASHGTVPDSVKKDLKNTLDEGEYKIIDTSEKKNDVNIRMKFKTVEVFQKTKQKVASIFKK